MLIDRKSVYKLSHTANTVNRTPKIKKDLNSKAFIIAQTKAIYCRHWVSSSWLGSWSITWDQHDPENGSPCGKLPGKLIWYSLGQHWPRPRLSTLVVNLKAQVTPSLLQYMEEQFTSLSTLGWWPMWTYQVVKVKQLWPQKLEMIQS